MKHLVSSLICFGFLVPAQAGEKVNLAKVLAPFLDDQTVSVLQINLHRSDPVTLFEKVTTLLKIDPQDLRDREPREAALAQVKAAGIKDFFVIVSLRDLPNPMPAVVVVVPPGKKAEEITEVCQAIFKTQFMPVPGQPVVAGPKAVVQRLFAGEPAARPEFARGLSQSPTALIQGVFALNENLRRAIREVLPLLPEKFGGRRTAPLLDGFQLAHVELNLLPRPGVRFRLEMDSADTARELQTLLEKTLELARQDQRLAKEHPVVPRLLKALVPNRSESHLELALSSAQIDEVLVPLAGKVRAAAERAQTINHMKQLGLAIHNYHDVHKRLPPVASTDREGNQLLSWRVHLLPFLGQEKLYKQFKLDEPWDSAHNKKLIEKIPAPYRSPHSRAAAGRTTFVAPIHATTVWGDPQVKHIRDITDGTSNTIFLLEADDAHAVIWTKPDDLPVDPKQPFRGIRIDSGDGFVVLIGDGSVRTLPRSTPPATLAALLSARGGEVVQWP